MRICASGSSPSSRLRLRKPEPTRVVSWPGPRWLGVTRKLFPEAFHRLDAVCEGRFPFSAALVEAAHAKWTSEWLAWERQHDLDYKRRASAAEAELSRAGETDPATVRARLAAIDQENASIATTDTYLNPGRIHLRECMERVEQRKSGTNVARTVARPTASVARKQAGQRGNALLH